jgi:hypothetical protein
MRRFLTLVCLLCVAIPAGISISGCTRNPAGNYCNGLGYGLKDTDVASIVLQPQTTGISVAFGQTTQMSSPTAQTCKGSSASVSSYTYGTTNNQIVDISPTGNICAGTWNRNTGGGIANYTVCSPPNPLPSNPANGLPYASAYVTASANSVSSNPVQVYVHPQVTSVTLALAGNQQCYSQGQLVQLDAQACIVGSNNKQELLCAPSTVSSANYACPLPSGISTVPNCSVPLGTLNFQVGNSSVGLINLETNQITAEQPGTTAISASVAQSGSSAGYFSTCPPASISVRLANGKTTGTITQGVQQNLTTSVLDSNNNPITGLILEYESTSQIDISASSSGGVTTSFPSVASVTAICQPPACNPAPINVLGLYGTGLPLASNPVSITVPGTASEYVWFGAPGQSQYFVPVELLSGTVGSPVRLPYVPNSMVMDELGQNLYFGSSHELMVYSSVSNTLSKTDINVPGAVLAVAPNNQQILINDQVRQVFYLYNSNGGIQASFGGVGSAASWTPDSQTLYITDSASMGAGHSDTLYVYNQGTGFTSYDLSQSTGGSQSLAITVPSVGAYLNGSAGFSTVARTWCPSGTIQNSIANIASYYPQGDAVNVQTDVLAATIDGNHILGAALIGGGVTLSDIGVTIPTTQCPGAGTNTLTPLTIAHVLNQTPLTKVNATAINAVVTSPASNLAFITYIGSTPGASLPYYLPGACTPGTGGAPPICAPGTANYLSLGGNAAASITAPVAGAFSPDNSLFFVSTEGDNLIHYISVPLLSANPAKADTQQIAPNLPACLPFSSGGNDPGCLLTTPTNNPVPATVIAVAPRSTT